MTSTSNLDLAEFRKAILRSEKVRTLCMIIVIGMFAVLGVFRILVPLDGEISLGVFIFVDSAAFLAMEIFMLRQVARAIEGGRPVAAVLARLQLVLECLFPLGLLFALALLAPPLRYMLLISPGYGFMLVLIGVSVLRVDRTATFLTGLVCFVGYTMLAAWVLSEEIAGVPNPHPAPIYFNLSAMLALATLASAFVAGQVRGYVAATVREMQTRREHDRLKRDLEIAGDIQQGLLPTTMPQLPQYEFAAVCRPADQAGGDYFDWQEIGSERVVFSVGDVTGHGVGPALVTAACRAYVRATIGSHVSPVALLERVNELLHRDIPEGKFVTLVLLDLDAENHRFRLLSAGHGPTLVVQGHGGDVRTLGSQGMPLGLTDAQVLDEPVETPLDPGDLVVAVSDGFFEWTDASDEAFGIERLQEVIRTNRHRTAEEILAAMEQAVGDFVGDLPQQDDVTGLVIRRVPG